jgi:DNA ligase D-like protein (predicted 3'-phosphoesterase)
MTDSLKAYREKRDFSVTAEPAGDKPRRSGRPIFVIQRHDASTLHYDFRLEVDGVLKSWAVPKGPPEKSGQRHLAVPTEDHPIAYADFEGVIPKGQYGAGTVEIWDSGTYRNLRAEIDGMEPVAMSDSLDEGKVEVFLDGRRLKGNYALIRMEGDEDEERWIMLRMKDGDNRDDNDNEL